MPFTVQIEHNKVIPSSAKTIMPVSMLQEYHTGVRLSALIEFANNFNNILLIADELHQYNSSNEAAVELGNKWLRNNWDLLKNAEFIKTEQQYNAIFAEKSNVNQNESPLVTQTSTQFIDAALHGPDNIIKIIRWSDWKKIKSKEYELADKIIEEASQEGSALHNRMITTAKKCFSSISIESSIKYQKEEYKVLLTMTEFDFHIYPKELTPAQKEVYKLTKQKLFKIPESITVRFIPIREAALTEKSSQLFLNNSQGKAKEKHQNSLPLVCRLILDQIDVVIHSSELSKHQKFLFINQLQDKLQAVPSSDESMIQYNDSKHPINSLQM